MGIKHTISGPKKDNTSSIYGRETSMARVTVENIIKSKDEQWMKYVLSVAKLKVKGDDSFIVGIKKLSDNAKAKVSISIDKGVLDKIRMINLHFRYNLDPSGAERFIKKFQIS